MDFLDFLIRLFTENGYLAVFLVLLVSGFGVPIPEDITLVAGGIIAGLGYANPELMCLTGLAGVMVGDSTMFLIGRHFGPRARRVRWVGHLLTPARYARVQGMFSRHGSRLMFIARFLPGLRSAVFLTAGMTGQIRFRRFFMLDGLAALISVPVWIYAGFHGAENRDWLLHWIQRGQHVIAFVLVGGLLVLGLLWWGRSARRRRRLGERQAERRRLQQQRRQRRAERS